VTTPFWFALLNSHCYEKAGLTLPFLVGASAIHRGAVARPEDANLIISEMNEIHFTNYLFYIAVCTSLQSPVITLVHNYGSGVKFCLSSEWGSNDEERTKRLLHHAEEPIRSGKFSRIREGDVRSWKPFQEDDLDQIDSVIKTHYAESGA
jgi:hypothetical protein